MRYLLSVNIGLNAKQKQLSEKASTIHAKKRVSRRNLSKAAITNAGTTKKIPVNGKYFKKFIINASST